ncbi:MAG: prolyl oligopeptidase family serine peptidase [Deltaproteobacteria bacterium]|nr:prolyl oligopeptidase family serine peptidase [Deltaproteobacteria bacterium]
MVIAAAALATLVAAGASSTITVGGVERSYHLFVPAGASPKAPLVVVLHGRFGTAEQVRRHSGMDAEAERRGALVLYPEGVDRRWNDLRQLTLEPTKRKVGTDDVGFILAVVDRLIAEGKVDPARVYVAGHSNGGFLALTLACTHAERFAGVGVVAATLPKTDCTIARALPVMLFHGTADPLVPFAGGGVGRKGERGLVQSNAETAKVFADKAGCQPPTRRAPIDRDPKDGTTVVVEDRAGCSSPVVNVVVEGGGHGWPGHPPRLSDATREIDATAWLAAFFLDGKGP